MTLNIRIIVTSDLSLNSEETIQYLTINNDVCCRCMIKIRKYSLILRLLRVLFLNIMNEY